MGGRYDPASDSIIPYPPHKQTVLNIMRVAMEHTSLLQTLKAVKLDPGCWFEPFQGQDLLLTYNRHNSGRAKMPVDRPYIPKTIAQVKAILTHPDYVGIRLYGSGPGAQKKLNALARKQKRGKVKSRLRVKPHFFGVFPKDSIFQSEEEQTLFWEIQKRYNPIDLRHLLETNYKEERPNPVVAQPPAGRPWQGLKNPFAQLVYCGAHGVDEDGEPVLAYRMRIHTPAVWVCSRDYDYGESESFCTCIRQRVLDRIIHSHVRLRLSGGQNHLDDLVQLAELVQKAEEAKIAGLTAKLANIQETISNSTVQLRQIDVKTDVGRFLFAELQERLAPLLQEKGIIAQKLAQEISLLRRSLTSGTAMTVKDALARIADKWSDLEVEARNDLLHLLLDSILVITIPGTRNLFIRFRRKDGRDDWLMSWYWGKRFNEPWADWEDEALRKMWDTERSARTILAALKPGRKWRTTRLHAAQKLGLKAHLKRPDVAQLLQEQDQEWVPADDSPTLVYHFLGWHVPGQLLDGDEVRGVHPAKGKV